MACSVFAAPDFMRDRPTPPQENRPIQICVIDDDPVFRLGLKVWLDQFLDLRVVLETGEGTQAWQALENLLGQSPMASESDGIDLVLLDIGLGRSNPDQLQGLTLCQRLKSRYLDLPVLLFSDSSEPVLLAAAQQAGANGYCPKGLKPEELLRVIRRVASGRDCWVHGNSLSSSVRPRTGSDIPVAGSSGTFVYLRRNLRRSGLQQIEATLADLTQQLQIPDLSLLDRAVLAGRRRELLASRWLVKRLLATPSLAEPTLEPTLTPDPGEPSQPSWSTTPINSTQPTLAGTLVPTVVNLDRGTTPQDVQTVLFDITLNKLQGGLRNQTETVLEIDILREEKKRELLYLILRKLEDLLGELRYSQILPDQLGDKRSPILLDLWQAVTTDFFGKYYTLTLQGGDVEVVSVLLQDAPIVQLAILDKIPFTLDLISHLLFQAPLLIDSRPCAVGSPDAMARAELLLDHLVIQIANAVMQPLLNRFADIEAIKQNFYDYRLISSREIERFRNNLSWQYRLARYFQEPTDMFESQHRLFTLYGRGIKQVYAYAPRKSELEQLSGIPFVVTLALETRDAIAPRLRTAISIVGSGVIYVLTDVIGRGIGLIGRGILKGVGGAWQDGKFPRGGGDRSRW